MTSLLNQLSPQQERKVFEKMFGTFRLAQKVSPQDTQNLQGLVNDLVAHWPDAPFDIEVFVLEDKSPNAFAFPGGYIGVTQGLLDGVETENELAFVLGHELGHFKERHHVQGLSRAMSWTLVQMMFRVAIGTTISQDFMFHFFETFSLRRHQQEQESTADQFGIDLVNKKYGHTRGADHFFHKIKDDQQRKIKIFEKFLSSHPLHEDRIIALEKLIRQKYHPAQNDNPLIPWPHEE